MNQIYTAIVEQDGDWWIGWIEEIPGVNCQEATREELLETLENNFAGSVGIQSSRCARFRRRKLPRTANCDMKRRELVRYLTVQGCELLREGGRHSWWHNPSQINGQQSRGITKSATN